MKGSPPEVLLVFPGYSLVPDSNFGDTQLVALGSYVQHVTDARVRILDLGLEPLLPHSARDLLFDPRFDVVGISAYNSFDYLKAWYLGVEVRKHNRSVCLVAGGYHASARPEDLTQTESPFDYVVVG